MESIPILFSALSTALATLNTYVLKRQSAHLKLIQGRSVVGLHEMDKYIHEKDEVLRYVYALYTTSTECYELLSSILSPLYDTILPYTTTLHTATVLVDTTIDIRHERFYTTWDEHNHPQQRFTFYASDHPDVLALVDVLTRLLGWCERKKHNHTAIHALHAGHAGELHHAVHQFTRFLHTTCDARIRVPLVVQKGIGGWWLKRWREKKAAHETTHETSQKGFPEEFQEEFQEEIQEEFQEESENQPSTDQTGHTPQLPKAPQKNTRNTYHQTTTQPPPAPCLTELHLWRHWFTPIATTQPLRTHRSPRCATQDEQHALAGYAQCLVRAQNTPYRSSSPLPSLPQPQPYPSTHSSSVASYTFDTLDTPTHIDPTTIHHLDQSSPTTHTYLVTHPTTAATLYTHYLHTHTHFSPWVHQLHLCLQQVDAQKASFHRALECPSVVAHVVRLWLKQVRKRYIRFARRYRRALTVLGVWVNAVRQREANETTTPTPSVRHWQSPVVMHRFRKALRRRTTDTHTHFVSCKNYLRQHVTSGGPSRQTPPVSASAPQWANHIAHQYAPVLFQCGWGGSGSGNRDGCGDGRSDGCDNGCSGSGELVVFLGHVKRLMESAERVIQEDIRFREGLMSGGRKVRMG